MNDLTKIESVKLRGRIFTKKDFAIIAKIVEKNYDDGITYISKIICKKLEWRQPNGWLKDRACREVLRKFEKMKIINLPPKKIKAKKNKTDKKREIEERLKNLIKRGKRYSKRVEKTALTKIDFGTLTLTQVKGTKDEDFWNWIVNKYHYLGFKLFVGRAIKYLIYSDKRIIAAIGFCDPAWSITNRDKLFPSYSKEEIRSIGINNGRFLILPWVKVPNLASHVISLSLRNLFIDWSKYYLVEPKYIETFVDIRKFQGTCYKASNWKYLGQTKGYKKCGNIYMNSQPSKAIYIYFFNKKLRKELEYV